MAWIGGKVLIHIEEHSDGHPYISVSPVTCSGGEDASTCLQEDAQMHLEMMGIENILSKRQMALPYGTRFLLSATIGISYSRDYWGEHDSDIEIDKQRTMYEAVPSRQQIKRWAFEDRKRTPAK